MDMFELNFRSVKKIYIFWSVKKIMFKLLESWSKQRSSIYLFWLLYIHREISKKFALSIWMPSLRQGFFKSSKKNTFLDLFPSATPFLTIPHREIIISEVIFYLTA